MQHQLVLGACSRHWHAGVCCSVLLGLAVTLAAVALGHVDDDANVCAIPLTPFPAGRERSLPPLTEDSRIWHKPWPLAPMGSGSPRAVWQERHRAS